jgi:uncharacterized repeat protein (TIGR01451 family)
MSKFSPSIRVILLGFSFSVLSCAAIFAAAQPFAAHVLSSIINGSSAVTSHAGARGTSEDNTEAASNGPIIFQRGFAAGSDYPFNRGGQLYKIDPSGTGETLFGDGSQPSYSWDGSKVVFTNNLQVSVTNADAYNPTGLRIDASTNGTGVVGGSKITGLYPKWSPDGAFIAYNTTSYAINILSWSGICATPDPTGQSTTSGWCRTTNRLNPGGTALYAYPSWQPTVGTPQGSVNKNVGLLFVRSNDTAANFNNGSYTSDIFQEDFTLAPDGTVSNENRYNLTKNPGKYAFPTFSHDQSKIAYVKFNADNSSTLWIGDFVVTVSSTGVDKNIVNPKAVITYPATGQRTAHHPVWSPDDSKIAFSDTSQIKKIPPFQDAIPSDVTTAANAAIDLWPSWAPGPTVAPANLQVVVSDSPDPVVADSPLKYTVSVTNSGQVSAPNVQGIVAIPDDALFVPADTSQGCVHIGTGRSVECSFGNIVPGDTISKQITVRPTGKSTQLTFNIGVINDANSAKVSAVETTVVKAGFRPANDNVLSCSSVGISSTCPAAVTGAAVLSGASGSLTGTNVGATPESPIRYRVGLQDSYEINHANVLGGKSVWYRWTPPANTTGNMLVDTIGSNFDTLLAAYSLDLTNGSIRRELASNNDMSEHFPDALSPRASQIAFQYDSKHVYFFVVDGVQGATGNIKLNWLSFPPEPAESVLERIHEISPAVACTTASTAKDICDSGYDSNGFFSLRVYGENFTNESRVLIRGVSVNEMKGFDRSGRAVSGQTSLFVEQDKARPDYGRLVLQALIPPNPPLNIADLNSIRVVTRKSATSGNSSPSEGSEIPPSVFTNLPDGAYRIAHGSRGLQTVKADKLVIQPKQSSTVCLPLSGNSPGYESCIDFTNDGLQPITVYPSFFANYAACLNISDAEVRKNPGIKEACIDSKRRNTSLAVNGASLSAMFMTIRKRVDLPPAAVEVIKTNGGTLALAFEAGMNSGAIVASGGGNLITNDGGSLIGNDGASVIGNDGASLITNDGGSLITNDGGSLITNDGGSLIGNDGAGLIVKNGFRTGGASLFEEHLLINSLNISKNRSFSLAQRSPASPWSAAAAGVGGLLLARSTGGREATFTTETDPLTGEVKGYISITLDNTSFPRASDVSGMAFTVLVNPAIAQFASPGISIGKSDGKAIVTLNRTGDSSEAMTVEYRTQDGTANSSSDYSPVSGTVTFAPGETSKQVTIPIINHGYGTAAFGTERQFNVVMTNVVGGAMQTPNYTTVMITNTSSANLPTNPLDTADAQFFVRQQYLDLLGREPTANELSSGAAAITQCSGEAACIKSKRAEITQSVFMHYSQAAAYVFRLYRASYGNTQPLPAPDTADLAEAKKYPAYSAFFRDRVSLAEGAELAATQLALAIAFVKRPEFLQKYPIPAYPDGASFVDAVLNTIKKDIGVDLATQRTALISVFDQAGGFTNGRGAVMYRLAEEAQSNPIANASFMNAEYNRAIAAIDFFGLLRRDGTVAELNARKAMLDEAALRDTSAHKTLIDGFLNSIAYRGRFGTTILAGVTSTVYGRVLGGDGRPLRNALVYLTNTSNNIRTVAASALGYFTFDNVPQGDTYTIKISSKKYRFANRSFSLTDNLTLEDFVGSE